MASLDHIIDTVCEASGADFAFVLTRRGRLATKRAPQEMPEAGRLEIVALADAILKQRSSMRHCEMPRQALVPYGGAAPVDVYVAAREEAILVVVMATFTSQSRVGAAMAQGLIDLDALLEMEGSKRSRRRGGAPDGKKSRPPAAKSSRGAGSSRSKSVAPPPDSSLDFDDVGNARGTVPFMVPLNGAKRPTPPPLPPEITMGEATIGRSTLAAIQVDEEGPDIRYGMAPIGRATVAEIELSMMPAGDPRSSIPDVRVELTSMPEIDVKELELTDRQTLPFTEAAIDSKRAFEAKTDSVVTVADSPNRRVLHGRSAGSVARPPVAQLTPPAPQRRAPVAKDSEKRGQSSKPPGRNSNIELWHRALGELGDDDEEEQTLKDVKPVRPVVTAASPSKRKTSIPPAAKSRPRTQAPPAAKSSRPLTSVPPAAKSSRPPKKK